MDSVTEDEDIQSKPTIRFTGGISLRDVMSDDGAIFEIKYDDDFIGKENESDNYDTLQNMNFEDLGFIDEDTYNATEPFESLAKKMIDIWPDGKVKKRILREGVGNKLPENSYVVCNYNAYIEYSLTPFDSTYTRHSQFKFNLDSGSSFPGFEIAVKSMKVSEKSQFLIHPDLAYGKMGCLSRVPPDTQVLFEIEIQNCYNNQVLRTYQNLNEAEQQNFSNVHEYVQALCLKGNNFFKKNLIRQAIKEYNSAVSKLETCLLADYEDQKVQQELLLRLYSNLVVSYTKIQVPRKACSNANSVYHLVKGTCLKVPAKVYFNNGRALMMLGDFDAAKQKLQIAKRLEPKNETIGEEFLKLEQKMKENHEREVKLGRTMFKSLNQEKKHTEVTEEFKETLKEYFTDLMNDKDYTQFNLPDKLDECELNYIKTNAPQFRLMFGEKNGKYFVYKESCNLDSQ